MTRLQQFYTLSLAILLVLVAATVSSAAPLPAHIEDVPRSRRALDALDAAKVRG
ncbi:hypothetical protein C2E23DRAFT_886940 [Lenzites betulinus]|nr:hypothetical protein C2E23DRAFT_886940 [Lenzites betulinus]